MKVETKLPATFNKLAGADEIAAIMNDPQIKECLTQLDIKKIESPAILEIVKPNIQYVKKIIKKVSDTRLAKTRALDKEKKEYMKLQDFFVKPLNDIVDNVNKVVATYLHEQAAKEAQRLEELRVQQLEKTLFTSTLYTFIENCMKAFRKAAKDKTKESLSEVSKTYLNTSVKSSVYSLLLEKYPEREKDLNIVYSYMVVIGKKISSYISGLETSKGVKDTMLQVQESLENTLGLKMSDTGEIEETEIREISSVSASVSKGTYNVINFEVVDFDKIPKGYLKLVVDESKIKEFQKENEKDIVAGKKNIPGIIFSVETKIRG